MSIKYFYSAGENEIYTNKYNDGNKYNTIKSCLSSNVILNDNELNSKYISSDPYYSNFTIFNIKDGTESGKEWGTIWKSMSAGEEKCDFGVYRPIFKCVLEHPNFGEYIIKESTDSVDEDNIPEYLPTNFCEVSGFKSKQNVFPLKHVNVYKDGKDVFNSFDLDNTICLTWEASEDELNKLRPNSAADDLELNDTWLSYTKNNTNTYFKNCPGLMLNGLFYGGRTNADCKNKSNTICYKIIF